MSTTGKVLVLFVAALPGLLADSITFNGPFGPTDSSVIGNHQYFDIQSATITQPTAPGGDWTVTINTNYGVPLPGSPDVVPPFTYEGVNLAPSDFLISSTSGSYGIILNSHDGYTAGDLYKAVGFQTAQQALNDPSLPLSDYHAADDVWLGPGGTLQGAGSLSAAQTGNGTTSAMYTITDTFQAPSNFLASGDFTVQVSSADCANGYLTGTGNFGGGSPGGGELPEPGTLVLLAPALFLLYRRVQSKA